MSEEIKGDIMQGLIDEKCFAEGGRLAIYPSWLKDKHIQSLISAGVFRKESGNLENYMHITYYLNPCREKIGLL